MFLISLVSVLVLVNSVVANDYEWDGDSPYSVLWVDPFNWTPFEAYGPDDCGDTAVIPSVGADPTVVVTHVTSEKVRGPAWQSAGAGDHEVYVTGDGIITVCEEWRVEGTVPSTAYITLDWNGRIEITGDDDDVSFNSNEDAARTIITMTQNSSFYADCDFKFGEDDDAYFELNMSDNAHMETGECDDGFRGEDGEFHVTMADNALLEAKRIRFECKTDVTHTWTMTEDAMVDVYDSYFNMAAGEGDILIDLYDNSTIIVNEDLNIGVSDDYKSLVTVNMYCGHTPYVSVGDDLKFYDDSADDPAPHIQWNLHGGTLNVEDEFDERHYSHHSWNIDICCDGIMVLNGDVTADMQEHWEEGRITVCGFGPCGGQGELGIVYDPCTNKTTLSADIDPNRAYDPDPPCATNCEGTDDTPVQPDVCLSWTPGQNPCEGTGDLQHFVYLSTDQEKVCSGNLSVLVAILPEAQTTYCPGALALGAKYWWMVKEVCPCNESDSQCWCFYVTDCMVVEDMEGYTEECDPPAVWEVWKDGAGDCNGIGGNGTGSSLFISTNPVHGGDQAMQYDYDSTGSEREGMWSEIMKTYDPPLNLVDNYEEAMVLWFYGDAGNDEESMWVILGDASSGEAQSAYGIIPPDSSADLLVEDWQDWNIDVQDQFADAGVDMSDVNRVIIGFGPRYTYGEDPELPTGTVYFDDISLCTEICVPKYAPDGDINEDCCVDWEDVDLMGDYWLEDRR
jgi:hypothetical protein